MGFGEGFVLAPTTVILEREVEAEVSASVEVIVPEFVLVSRSPALGVFSAEDYEYEELVAAAQAAVLEPAYQYQGNGPVLQVEDGPADEDQEVAVTPSTEVVVV